MSSLKQLKAEQKTAARFEEVVEELNVLVKDVERCERTIMDLKAELSAINTQHRNRKTTREDIAYLEALLNCARKAHVGKTPRESSETNPSADGTNDRALQRPSTPSSRRDPLADA